MEPPARPRVAVPRSGYGPPVSGRRFAGPPTGRPPSPPRGAPQPRTVRRPPPPFGRRRFVLAALLAVTIAIGLWFLLLRGSGAPPTRYEKANGNVVRSIDEVIAATGEIQSNLDFPQFLETVTAAVDRSRGAVRVFADIASSEDGEAASIARRSASLGRRSVASLQEYAHFVVDVQLLNEAAAARRDLEQVSAELARRVKAWKRL